jgi:hypothetical protein
LRWFLRLIGLLFGLLAVFFAAALTAPRWLAEDSVRQVIARHLGVAIKGEANLRGPLQWRLFPTPKATLTDVSLASSVGNWSAVASTVTVAGTWTDLWREAQKLHHDGPGGPPVPASPTGPDLPGWSREAIDLSDFRLGAGTMTMQAKALRVGSVKLGRGSWTVNLENGVLQVALADGEGLGGILSLFLTLDTNGSELIGNGNLKGRGLDAGQVAEAVGGAVGSVRGRLSLDISAKSRGASVAALVDRLDGGISADLADGSLRGIDLGSLLRAASQRVQGMPGGVTTIGKGKLRGTVRRGIMTIDDGSFIVPPLTVEASGQVGLGRRSLALSLNPKLDPSLGILSVPISVLVPVEVSGSWNNPVFRPELEQLPAQPLRIACDILSKAGGPVDKACDSLSKAVSDAVGGGAKAIGNGAQAVTKGLETVGGGIAKGVKCIGSVLFGQNC